MSIRNAVESDYNQINKLFSYSDQIHFANHPEIYSPPQDQARSMDYFKTLISGEENILLVAEEHNVITGFIYCYIESAGHIPIHTKRKYIVIDNIVVKKEYQHQGIGTLLLKTIEDKASSLNLDHIELDVFEFNENAVSLYKSKGFKNITWRMRKDI